MDHPSMFVPSRMGASDASRIREDATAYTELPFGGPATTAARGGPYVCSYTCYYERTTNNECRPVHLLVRSMRTLVSVTEQPSLAWV
jgi:hypothetical protein